MSEGGRHARAKRIAVVVAVVAVAFAIALAGRRVSSRRPPNAPPSSSASFAMSDGAELAVEISGCAAILRGGTCERADGAALRVFVRAPASQLAAFAGAIPIAPAAATNVDGGTLLTLKPPDAARSLTIRRFGETRTIALAAPTAASERLTAARVARERGDLAEAERQASAEEAAADPVARTRAVSLRARVALARGDEQQVEQLFARSIDENERAGRVSDAADDAFAYVYALIRQKRFADARRLVTRALALSSDYPDGRARGAYFFGWIEAEIGDWRDARRDLADAIARAKRVGLIRLEQMARTLASWPLLASGRASEAADDLLALYDRDGATMKPCDLADLAGTIGYAAMEDRARGKLDARDWLRRAIVLYRDQCAGSYEPGRLSDLLTQLSRAELEAGDRAAAAQRLDEASDAMPHPSLKLELERLRMRGHLALADSSPKAAMRAFQQLEARAEAVSTSMQRVALEGEADAYVAEGNRAAAERALARASALVDRESIEIPLGEGREGFLRAHDAVDRKRVDLLIDLGRPAEALAHLRRARARLVASLEQTSRVEALSPESRQRWEEMIGRYRRERDALDAEASEDWKLAAATLSARVADRYARAARARAAFESAIAGILPARAPPPNDALREGDVVLALSPGADAMRVLVSDGRVTRASRAAVDARASNEALGAELLAPFAGMIHGARRVVVAATADARRVDVHALPFEGAPLESTVAVAYLTDASRARVSDRGDRRGALLVGDPTLDLGGAHRELEAVAARLAEDGGPSLTVLRGDAATGSAVRAALAKADLFHYAGHAGFAGRDGWESALRLAAGAQMTVADVLALPRAPRDVVLLGCETGRESEGSSAEGLGLAQAFVLAGSERVVAATRVVDDEITARFAAAMYARIATGAPPDDAYRAAAIELTASGARDVAAFRLLVP